MSKKHKENTRFNNLEVIRYTHTDKNRRRWYLCRCDCGNEKEIRSNHLNSGQIKSCGCLLSQPNKRKKPDNLAQKNILMSIYKKQAQRRKIDFSIDREYFYKLLVSNCHYCNSRPNNNRCGFLYSGIDRVDNKIGYTKDNCVPCCKDCNFAKSNKSLSDFIIWVSKVYRYSIDSK